MSSEAFARELAHLSPKQRAVLELRLKRKHVAGTPMRIPYFGRGADTFPLSFAQQRLWFIDQLEPGSAFYNAPAAVRLKGPLNVAALDRTLNEIVRRHESLHTRFATIDGQPHQVIDPSIGLSLRLLDLRRPSEQELLHEIRMVTKEEAASPFDLTTGPLLRASLLRLGEQDYLLHLTMHHIISDGWSLGVFFNEMSVLYQAYISGQDSPLPELPVQYVDYAMWQRQYFQGEVLEKQLSYWRDQLAGAAPMLELITDYTRPAVQSFRGASQLMMFSKRLRDQLQQLSHREGVTLFMSLWAAFNVLLWRYTGQADLSVGTPIAGRKQSETEGLIGFFVNTLVLRVRVDGNESFLDLLNRVREVTLGAYAHQDVPFERLVEEMQPERDMSHHPLFQVMFVIHTPGREMVRPPELELSNYPVESGLAKFDLTLLMTDTEEGLQGSLEYNTDLFDAALVQRMARHFETLVESAVSDPYRPLQELSLSTADERRQLLIDWNPRETVFPRNEYVHTLIQAQARQTPEATAVVCGLDELSYAELNARANQLAHYLHALGVGPEVLVGVCMERSLDVIVSLLAILKAGGAYLPLDPENPSERLAHMLEETRMPVLLTQQRQLQILPEHHARAVCLDVEWPVIAQESEADLDNLASEENLAYVIYTSGSTGRPKGVCISQQAACRHFKVIQKEFGLTANDRVLQFASLSFDVSLEQILPTLMSGACVVLRSAELWTPADFSAKAHELKLTVANLPTAYWHQVVSEAEPAGTPLGERLRLLIIGGDMMLPESTHLGPQAGKEPLRLLNAYGPTETTVTSSVFDVPRICQGRSRARVPIGRPLANRAMYVLDSLGALAPVSVPGELCIGGAFLARGYLKEPELTAEKFVPDPYSKHPGARLYRTGDLARFLPDGNIEFLGRMDHQVKIRGYRIELGEIESALADHPLLQEAVVIARTDSATHKRLVAYLVSKQQQTISVTELRSYLKEHLPEYMIPSAFVFLERLPLTANGKVDRRALPAPGPERVDGGAGYVAPRTIVEEVLVGLWGDVLGVKQVGVYDNFFELGGHSLLATQLMSRVRQSFAVEVALRRIFETPTIAALAENIEELRFGGSSTRRAVARVTRGERLPLSYAQQRLWFLEQMEPGSAIYNVPLVMRVSGELAVGVLEASLREVIRRHEVLRTRFELRDGEAEQVIEEEVGFKLAVEDLSGLAPEAAELAVQEQARAEAQQGFDLRRGPLLRAKLLQLSASEQVLLLTMHHIVSDGWSLGVLVKEMGTLYQAYAQGESSPLAELGVQYADYAVWQREYLQGEVLEQQLRYWRAQLAGAAPVLELPTDYARPAVLSNRGASQAVTLSPDLTEQLQQLSRREGVTLFMSLLAAFDVLLWRYTGQTDLSVGTPIAGRNQAEIEELIGFFVNTLVLRVQMDGRESYRELLGRVREVMLGAYGHQDVPFERLVEELQPERDRSHTPLFQVAFALQNVPLERLELPGLSLRPEASDNHTAKFNLVLILAESDSGLQGSLSYNTELFDAVTIERMVRHYTMLLSAIASNPDQPIAALPMLTDVERDRLLVEWNDTESLYPRESCIQRLFEEQVARTPTSVAVVQGDQRLSYAELNRRANQLARYLQKQGVGPDDMVGICVERGIELIVGLLGILKAGGAYVPFDPNYPPQRLSFMLEDSGVAGLLTQESLIERLPEHPAWRICLDTDWKVIAEESEEDLISEVQAENLAYVIYTSGSTGNPKGACITHRAVIRLVVNTDYIHLKASDKIAQASNAAFDAATFEIWGALLHGAQLIILNREVILSPPAFAAQIQESGITVLFLTTALFNQLADQTPRAFANLRYLLFGGELVDPRWVRRVLENGPPEHLLHVYGPTETTTYSTWYPVQELRKGANTVPIGRPIANSQTYLLDKSLEPVPVGIPGELYIGGDGLQRCYLNHPELTAEKFVPHPFAQDGARLYRTEDLARYLPDGNIEFLGRVDYQVKLRGFRVELGEIEVALNSYPDLRESVVVLREDGIDKRLVGYVVANEEAAVTARELRGYLKEQLPEYMIPAAFVFLEKLPLTANGKVDRQALPAPEQERVDGGAEYVAPRTVVEEVLVGLWGDVLEVKQVGVYDNFFELGGHSLLATQLMSRVRQSFAVDLPLRVLFESPSVDQMAQLLVSVEETPGRIEKIAEAIKKLKSMSTEDKDEIREQMRRSKGASIVNPKESLATEFSTDDLDLLAYLLAEEGVELKRTTTPRRRAELKKLPLSYAQQRLWFLEQMEPGSAIYNVPLVMRVSGELAVGVLEASLREVIRRHEVLRTRFELRDGEAEQVIEEQVGFKLAVEDLSGLAPEAAERAVQEQARAEAQQGFDLRRGPLLRAKLLQLSASEQVLLLTMHHIVSDGWSLGVLVKEMGTLYQAYAQGESSPLAELGVQYADYAVWQREYLQGEVLEQQLRYWRAQLAGAAPVLELPTDRPRLQFQTFNGSVLYLGWPVELSEKLMALSRREGVTLFMSLLAAFDVLLWRYTGQTDLSVGTPIAGRNQSEIEGLIGFFVNTLVLRVQMDGRESYRELLGRVREVTLGAYGHQDVPFERLVEEMQPERDLSHTPLFQVAFASQNISHEQIELKGLSLKSQASDNRTAKFDLTLRVYETDAELLGSVEYNTDLFERSTMTRLLDHFQTLLESISTNPDLPISKLNWLPETERREILKHSNGWTPDYRSDVCLHQWFETQVERSSDAPAVTYDGATITYKELNQRANQLAHYLRKLNVGPESRVAICVERSLELVVGILSILKAGGAYVPLDPALPTERLSFMLADAGTHVLLTQERLIPGLPEFAGEIVRLDHDWELIADESNENPGVKVLGENAAYVIHTSGSTGKPKGVVITHSNVVRLLEATRQWFNFGAADVWTLFHSYAFDFSVWELWGALLYGGRLVVVPYLVSRTPEAFYDLLRREQVTVLNQTPSAFRQLISAGESADAELDGKQSLSLRLVIFGGEALELQSLQPWFARWGDDRPQLVNMYGITETTVHVTYRPLTAADLRQPRGSLVGRPIPDLQVYVLDEQMQLVPFGIAGELYVGGHGLARGYLNRPHLTAERFVPDPFGDSAGARLYKTGDKARYLADGDIEYLGRLDQQVKIRGHRIELGEIEAVLSGHESVREVAVIAKREESGDQRLLAYVSLRDELSVDELRGYMKRHLPEYMAPATFVMVDQLPLTTNGKVNRQALPDPAQARPHLDQPYVAPRMPIEEILAAVWAGVLGVEEVGVHDNYFALGGDSIRSVQVLALAKERGLEISLQQLFRHQSIAELAQEIKLKEIDPLPATRIEPFGLISENDRLKLPETVEDAYPLTMLQMGMFYHMELMPEAPLYHNVNSWPLDTPFNHEAFQDAVENVLARHPIFRTSFDLTNYSEPLQLVHRTAPLPVPVVDLRHVVPAEQNKILDDFVKCETQRPFDLSSPPLLRFHFHLLTDKTVQFTLTECHAILDGWSLTSTLAEIFTHYFALLDNQTPPAQSPPTFLYRDFVRLERLALESEECRQYWDDKLRGSKPLKLPRLHGQNGAPDESRIRTIHVPISSQLIRGLRRVARIAKVPIKSVLLAAHMKVLSLLSGRSDVMGGLLCNGRPEEMDGAQVRGLFLNAVPLRLHLEDGNWLDLVRQAFEAEWELLPYRRYPLAAMQRKAGGQPLFETQFNYVHFHALSGVLNSGQVEIQSTGIRRSEETQFVLATAFTSDILSSTLDLVLEFDMRELSAEQTDAIASYYALTLDAIACDPLARHHEAALLPAQEQSQLLVEWTDTSEPYPETCLHRLFEAQVERTPDATAVSYEDQELNYRELNEQANQLAHYLRALGVGPEVKVGVFMDRSLEMVIGLLGILKAGGAYVPFDTAYPKERLAFMLEDSQITLLLGQERLADNLPPHAARFICLERDWEAITSQGKTNPVSGTTPENLLYVLYTSGSTGKPKGAMLSHSGIVNCIHWMQKTYQLTPADRFLFKTSLNFDPSVWEVFWPLTVGAAVVTARPGGDQDAAYLVDCIIKHGITGIYFVPSLLKLLLNESRLSEAGSLRFVICGGESLPRETVERFFELSNAALHHSYGPTETSIAVTESACVRENQRGPIPIGQPLANTRVYVLDKYLQPAPIGVPGELYVGGRGLARGYLQRPELTAERFVPDPFSSEPGSRLYVTGDQVRYWRDGDLEFLGRTDDQVKVRGFRIELGEVVAVLEQHPTVREAIVVAGHDSAGTQRLAAYILRAAGATPSHSELRSFLETKLPKYMAPSAFVFLESWPLMANGKLDRHALPEPESVRPQSEIPYVAPRTELERIIASLWQEVLQIEMVGTNDNFFDLGGHSLSMLQVHNKLRQSLNRPISMVDMFQYPTVSSMSKYLSLEQAEEVADQVQVRMDFRQQSALRQRQLRKTARNS